jgi:hypothetical protein
MHVLNYILNDVISNDAINQEILFIIPIHRHQ